jgi:hypothetical protein
VAVAGLYATSNATSHRDAPFTAGNPRVDATDFYFFRSYEEGRDGFVTFIANWFPFADPYSILDPNAFYRINIDNNRDGREDIIFEIRFKTKTKDGAVTVPNTGVITPDNRTNQNIRTKVIVTIERPGLEVGPDDAPSGVDPFSDQTRVERVTDAVTGNRSFKVPVGRTPAIPNYDEYDIDFVHNVNIPGCGEGRLFAGLRADQFFNVYAIIEGLNVGVPYDTPIQPNEGMAFSIALEVPIDCLTTLEGDFDGEGVDDFGAWTTAILPTFNPDLNAFQDTQVSRLGLPYVNQIAIERGSKDAYNASHPVNDAQWIDQSILILPTRDIDPFEHLVGNDSCSNGFLSCTNLTLSVRRFEPPTPFGQQNPMGVAGGDPAGFPNGRRPGDNVENDTFKRFGITGVTFANRNPGTDAFPYLPAPQRVGGIPPANGGTTPPPPSDPPPAVGDEVQFFHVTLAQGTCTALVNPDENFVTVDCRFGALASEIQKAVITLGENGPVICSLATPPLDPTGAARSEVNCPLSIVLVLQQGEAYARIELQDATVMGGLFELLPGAVAPNVAGERVKAR